MSVDEHKKSYRGRPRVDSEMVRARMERGLLDAIDAWIEAQLEPRPTRPEAIRRLVEKGLETSALGSPPSDASLDRQIAKKEAAIDEIPEHAEPSPEAALAAMDKALAENELIDMKNKRTRRKMAKRAQQKPPA